MRARRSFLEPLPNQKGFSHAIRGYGTCSPFGVGRGDAAGIVRANVSEDPARDWGSGGGNLRRTHDFCRAGFAHWTGDGGGSRSSVYDPGSESRGRILSRASGAVTSGFVSHARSDGI